MSGLTVSRAIFQGYMPSPVQCVKIAALATVVYYALKQVQHYFTRPPALPPLEDDAFWKKIAETPTKMNETGPVTIGDKVYPTLDAAQKAIFSACKRPSDFVQKHLITPRFNGSVLDLGAGKGANAIPLKKQGCSVTTVEKDEKLSANLVSSDFNTLQGDITKVKFPENRDVILCVDVFPYMHPSSIQATLRKIHAALRPGGGFIGTLFFAYKNNFLTDTMMSLGAHFYKSKEFTEQMITRSGFTIMDSQLRNDGADYPSHCFEFYAQKPH